MSSKVGPLSFDSAAPGELVFDKPYSEATAQLIDQEVNPYAIFYHQKF